MPTLVLSAADLDRLRHGQRLSLPAIAGRDGEELVARNDRGEAMAIVRWDAGLSQLLPHKVLA
jgi:hypothetical protein